ncbi:restriction endonuclease subunit S [Piscinibacter sp.]|uniref:restriction endonuclease subunit S n=1 Tax=Piscinibacter sp. TaxID=1903157 RepID=UPI0025853FAF|nr:restriction endonuclease subunit S [Piscinibacter sp.]
MTLRQAGVNLIDCDHRTPPAADAGFPYIAIPQLKDGHLDLTDVRRISEADFIEWTKKLKPRAHDVIVVRRCNSGDSALIPPDLECAIGQNLVVLRSESGVVHPKFLRWLVRGPEWWDQVGKYINVGAVFDSLRCRDIPNFELTVPPFAEQVAIAEVLDALDDRIALLRETNATLESIAQALFKSWFVDFDPVHAKSQGLAPAGMDEATAALFPDGFEDSLLGQLPAGWRTGSILEIADLLSGGTPKTDRPEYWGGEIAWASAKDVSQSSGSVLVSTERSITAAGLERSPTKLIPRLATVVVARGATTGRMVMFGREMAMNQTCYGLTSKLGTPVALYCLLRREMDVLVNAAHGSVFDTITTSTFAKSIVVHAPEELLVRFESIARPMFERITESTARVQTLAALRDALLPRLISGQLRLPEAEQATVELA